MERLSYRSVDPRGKIHTGTLEVRNEQELIEILREKQLVPIKVEKAGKASTDVSDLPLFKKKVKLADLTVFCRQLGTMLKAGLPLDRAVSTQIQQTENSTLKEGLIHVDAQVRQGIAMSVAMKDQPAIFPKILTNMVESGELTGGLDDALMRMAVHFDKENKVARKIKGAMIYPIVLFCLTIIVSTGLILFAIPQFTAMFAEADQGLPALTQFFVDLSDAMRTYWYLFVGGGFGLFYIIRMWLNSENGRRTFDGWKLSIRLVKKPMTQIVTARFTRTLSTMLSSGISILRAMESAAETTNNVVVVEAVRTITADMKKGIPLARLLRGVGIFPEMMMSMISIGEETGELDDMLAKTADYYDEEFEAAMQKMVSLMEPLLIVFMGVIIGAVVIAMYLPMFDIYGTM